MKISDAAAEALSSAIIEASTRLGGKRHFGVAVVPSRGDAYFDIFLVKVQSAKGGLDKQKEKRVVKRALIPVRIQELLKGTPLRDPIVFLHWQEGAENHGWRLVNSDLNPIDLDGAPFSVPYKD